jgi:hypothetical protein
MRGTGGVVWIVQWHARLVNEGPSPSSTEADVENLSNCPLTTISRGCILTSLEMC